MNKQELKELVEVRNNELQDVNYWASDYHKGHDRATRFFLHLLDQLDEPEITEKQAWEVIKKHTRSNEPSFKAKEFYHDMRVLFENAKLSTPIRSDKNLYDCGYRIAHCTEIEKTELPVIPQFVADWYEKNKDILEDNIDALIRNSRDGGIRRPIETWMLDKSNRPIETLIRMKDGYTIEAEPKWVVKVGKGYFSGYDETKITYVLGNSPGENAERIVYDDLDEAESDAEDIGGVVEEWKEDE